MLCVYSIDKSKFGALILLNDRDYSEFCSALERKTGIVLGADKQYLVATRLKNIVDQERYSDVHAVVRAFVSGTDSKINHLVTEVMTTNETSWFRDRSPYAMFREFVLPSLREAKIRAPRIWSAACSYGQEPYSLAMVFEDFLRDNPGSFSGLSILATDLSTEVLEFARAGSYDRVSMRRGIDDGVRDRFFVEKGDRWEISESIKRYVNFRQFNLLGSYGSLGRFDVVFCRNVLIYFSAQTKSEILDKIASVSNPNGFLFLGSSESASSYSQSFEISARTPSVVYQKKG